MKTNLLGKTPANLTKLISKEEFGIRSLQKDIFLDRLDNYRAPLKIFNIIPTFNEKLEFLETNEINYYFMLKLALFWLNLPNFTLQKGGFLHFFKLQTYFSYSTSRNVSCYKLHSSCLPSTDYA